MAFTLKDRLLDRMAALNMRPADLARAVNLRPPSISLWLDGTTKSLKGTNLLRAASALGVTPDWLATGRGRKLADDPIQASVPRPVERMHDDPVVVEAIAILEAMTPAARTEAVGFLKVFAAKKGHQPTHGQGASIPAESKDAA